MQTSRYAPKKKNNSLWYTDGNTKYQGTQYAEGLYAGLNFKYFFNQFSNVNLGLMYEMRDEKVWEEKTGPNGREVLEGPIHVRSNLRIMLGAGTSIFKIGPGTIDVDMGAFINTSVANEVNYQLANTKATNSDALFDIYLGLSYRFR